MIDWTCIAVIRDALQLEPVGNKAADQASVTAQDYAYYSIDEYCNKNREDRTVVSIDSNEDVPTNDEASLAKAVTVQPVSVAICASELQFYASGELGYSC